MDRNSLNNIFKEIKNARIAVLGDFCLDAYWEYSNSDKEYSEETKKLVNNMKNTRYSLGGASNVINNLAALGVKYLFAIGIIGKDAFGSELERLLMRKGININNLIIDKDFTTPVYVKPVLYGIEQERFDLGKYNKVEKKVIIELQDRIIKLFDDVDILVVNQQIKNSFYSNSFINFLNELFSQHKKLVILDSRDHCDKFQNIILKINEKEILKYYGSNLKYSSNLSDEVLKDLMRKVYKKTKNIVFVSRGEKGISYFDGLEADTIKAIKLESKIDIVGAGDTVLAALAIALYSGCSINQCAEFANLAASITVRKINQTGTASKSEILKIIK